MSDEELLAEWSRTFTTPTRGWAFATFEGRVTTEEPPWSYTELAREALAGARSVLDLGTGGGEFLRGLSDALPSDTHATEGWAPNVAVARAALAPHGIAVLAHDPATGRLPLRDGSLDVVLDRHAAYDAADVARVLRPGGVFLTQQVDGRNLDDLGAVFGAGPAFPDVTLDALRAQAEEAGLQVVRGEEWSGAIRFTDVTTLLEHLRRVPWHLPADFSVERHAEDLLRLRTGELAFTERRILLHTRRPTR